MTMFRFAGLLHVSYSTFAGASVARLVRPALRRFVTRRWEKSEPRLLYSRFTLFGHSCCRTSDTLTCEVRNDYSGAK